MILSTRSARGTIAGAAAAVLLSLGVASTVTSPVHAQADSAAALKVGDRAPDFRAPGATRYGLLRDPVSLSDYNGKTVVIAFFFKARTKG